MKTVQVLSLQSLFDIAIQNTGDVTNVFEIALVNGKSITEDLVSGETILIPEKIPISSKAFKYLTDLNISPATAITIKEKDDLLKKSGIGKMRINSTFIVG